MKGTLKTLRKGGIFILGVIVIIAGIILLAIPGPGLLVIVGGLLILSTEFDWAKDYLHRARQKLKEAKDKIKSKNNGVKSAKDVDRPGNHQGKRKS